METTAMSPGRGGAGRKRADGRAKTQSSATTTARGGEANYTTEKEKNHIVRATVGVAKLPRVPPCPEGGDRQEEKETNTETYNPAPQ